MVAFDYDKPDVFGVALIEADSLEDHDQLEEAELIRIQAYIRRGEMELTPELGKRIRELQELLEIKSKLPITKVENKVVRGRTQQILHRLYLDDPLGARYTKATLHLNDLNYFKLELESQPVVSMSMYCLGLRVEDIRKYLNYRWLRKLQTVELNNAPVTISNITDLFRGTDVIPWELIITGRQQLTQPTLATCKMMKRVCPNLKQLKKITWFNQTYNLEN